MLFFFNYEGAAGNFLSSVEDLSVKAFSNIINIDLIGTFTMCNCIFKYR